MISVIEIGPIVFSKPKNPRNQPIAHKPAAILNQAGLYEHARAPDNISDSIIEPQNTIGASVQGVNEYRVDFGIAQENPFRHFQTSQGFNNFRFDSR